MGLKEKIRLSLESKGFDKLYDDHKQVWIDLANDARTLMKPRIAGGNPTVDDIQSILEPLIELHEYYLKFMEDNPRLTQQYWANRFTTYVLHRVYSPTLHVQEKKPQEKPHG